MPWGKARLEAGTWGRNPWARLVCTHGSPGGKWELIAVS